MMQDARAELIFTDAVFARNQAEIGGCCHSQPIALLLADRAIALEGAALQVEIGIVADGAAMAASMIGLLHHTHPSLEVASA
ncbi:hypothetical protein FHT29_001977 [Rhizobium sp. SG741]|nr:hypothetical protein [Rhizobium sp. SG741]